MSVCAPARCQVLLILIWYKIISVWLFSFKRARYESDSTLAVYLTWLCSFCNLDFKSLDFKLIGCCMHKDNILSVLHEKQTVGNTKTFILVICSSNLYIY